MCLGYCSLMGLNLFNSSKFNSFHTRMSNYRTGSAGSLEKGRDNMKRESVDKVKAFRIAKRVSDIGLKEGKDAT